MATLELPDVSLDYQHMSMTLVYKMGQCPSHDELMQISSYLEAAYEGMTVSFVDVVKETGLSWTDGTFRVTYVLNNKERFNG